MKFSNRKQRQAPTIIIISLIDILIVLLIFLMVTTTFKQQPTLRLALPESKEAKDGSSNDSHHVVVTVSREEPYFYFGQHPVTLDRLEEEVRAGAARDPQFAVSIRPDAGATVDRYINAVDAVRSAGVKSVLTMVKRPTRR